MAWAVVDNGGLMGTTPKNAFRVSGWAAEELRRRSEEEGRTVVAIIDRLLSRPSEEGVVARRPVSVESRRERAMKSDAASVDRLAEGLCRCGHPALQHRPKCMDRKCDCREFRA
jgi:hypothetical protein